MGVYVKGMMMPEDCKECQFENYLFTTGQTWCVAKMEILAIQGRLVSPGYKPKWCPLVEVKAREEI